MCRDVICLQGQSVLAWVVMCAGRVTSWPEFQSAGTRVSRSDHRLWGVPGSLAFTLTWILGIVRLYWKWNLDLEPVPENKPQSNAIADQGEQKALEWGSYPDRRKCEIWEAKAFYREKNGPRLLGEGEPRAGSCFFGSELKLITSRWRFLRIPQLFLLMQQS